MIQPAPHQAVSLRVTGRAAHVALRNLCVDGRPRSTRTTQVEPLLRTGTVVEVEPSFLGTAVNAAVLALVSREPLPTLSDVAIGMHSMCRRVGAIPRCLAVLVSLPCLRGVLRFSARHAVSLPPVDYWGDQSLGTAQMGDAA